jgi:hypothetical protein
MSARVAQAADPSSVVDDPTQARVILAHNFRRRCAKILTRAQRAGAKHTPLVRIEAAEKNFQTWRAAPQAEFREDLKQNPNNGWSLLGLAQSLAAQGKREMAAHMRDQFDHAWQRADVQIERSRL